ncbi:hypothetical protein CL656_04695 [bacterium]|nr:hypothetical protein [bacterium]
MSKKKHQTKKSQTVKISKKLNYLLHNVIEKQTKNIQNNKFNYKIQILDNIFKKYNNKNRTYKV